MNNKRRVLFLCTGNAARSQMAQGLVNHFLGERWEAFSAGTQPVGDVHPLAIQVMAEIGIDISHHTSKHLSLYRNTPFDVVITVCDDAAKNCPVWLGEGRRIHIGFPDPAAATGTPAERLAVFRQVREGIRTHIIPFLQGFPASMAGKQDDEHAWRLNDLQ